MQSIKFHESVLLNEVKEALNIKKGEKYIDATAGGGGHTAAIVARGGVVLGLDVDPVAVSFARKRLAQRFKARVEQKRFKIAQGNFRDLDTIAKKYGFGHVAGILFDLGLSSYQLEGSGRGFSFKKEEPLDMRMDPSLKVRAQDIINGLTRRELYDLFTRLGEENLAKPYSFAIYRARRLKPIETSKELAEILYRAYRRKCKSRPRIHPATRVFQALRIAVNDEINNLKLALPRAVGLLKAEGRLVVISFHSLEDRVVKRLSQRPDLNTVNGLIRPSKEEMEKNPRSSSAKMRVFSKVI